MNFTTMYSIINNKYKIKTKLDNIFFWERENEIDILLERKKLLYKRGINPFADDELYKIEFYVTYIHNYLVLYLYALYNYILTQISNNKFSEIKSIHSLFMNLYSIYQKIKTQYFNIL